MSVSVKISIVHKLKTSNALYVLVQSEHERFEMCEFVSANTRITQVVWQRIPHRRTNHRESPSGSGV